MLLVERLMGDEELAAEIMEAFVVDTRSNLLELARAVSDRDAPSIQRLAHTMKGAAGNVGAVALSEPLYHLESAGMEKRLADVDSALQEAEDRFHEVILILDPLPDIQTGDGG